MGRGQSSPSDALFSKTQRRVLGLLFGNPDRSFYANEVVRFTRGGVGAVQRELEGLAAAGLVTVSRLGNQKHYRANPESPIFHELRSIVSKLLGGGGPKIDRGGVRPPRATVAGHALPAALTLQGPQAAYAAEGGPQALPMPRGRIAELCRKYGVKKLSLFGSAARGQLRPDSDVDLMVEFDPGSKASLWDLPAMQAEFSAVFGNRRVDLVPTEVLRNPFRRKAILPELKVLYET
jgi:predicted nucleotidyltransferase